MRRLFPLLFAAGIIVHSGIAWADGCPNLTRSSDPHFSSSDRKVEAARRWLEFARCGDDSKNLVSRDLQGCSYVGANLNRANFIDSNLTCADFRGANLKGAKFIAANLTRADFRGANLEDAKLIDANLQGADFRGANLHRADLEGAATNGANFKGATR